MDNEFERIYQAVKDAIEFEIEGKNYYERSATESNNESVKQLFSWLAEEEEKHRNRFEQIYEKLRERKSWPKIKFQSNYHTIANNKLKEIILNAVPRPFEVKDELFLIDNALKIEYDTENYYKNCTNVSHYASEKAFYDSISTEEHSHYVILNRLREFIIDPSSFYIELEKPSLDGA